MRALIANRTLRWHRICAQVMALIMVTDAQAWTDHALLTRQALLSFSLDGRDRHVAAETLEVFLKAEQKGVGEVIANETRWAVTHVPEFRPSTSNFGAAQADGEELRALFLRALRVNPDARMGLFLQNYPGRDFDKGRALSWTNVTTLRSETVAKKQTFTTIRAGDLVDVLDVVSTASDEPDYGMDIGLWEDNGTRYGKEYGFGSQPFGNPKLENSTQAPFHMGFFHESSLLYSAAPFLHRTYSRYRIHLYAALARYAFESGHPYWGWRFSGWSLHYVQDLTQPYHAKALPDVGLFRIVWASALDALGIHGPKQDAIQLVSNRHLVLENYEYHCVQAAYLAQDDDNKLMRALSDTSTDGSYPSWVDDSPVSEVSLEANRTADDIDSILSRAIPGHLVSNPEYVFSESDPNLPNIYVLVRSGPSSEQAELEDAVARLMHRLGTHTRRELTFILNESSRHSDRAGS